MQYFSSITATVASLTTLAVYFDGITVYRSIYPYGFVPHTIVIIVLCRDIWCKIKVDEEK